MSYALIALFTYTGSKKELFTYCVPPELALTLKIGHIVNIPFHKQILKGLVLELSKRKPAFKTKSIINIIIEKPIPSHLIKVITHLHSHCVSPYKLALGTAIPFNSLSKKRRTYSPGIADIIQNQKFLKLNPEQENAYRAIKKSIIENNPETHLLMGVTGSGKTEIYLHAINDVIKKGKRVIVLVPEIALTPQTYSVFIGRFPGQVAIWHSNLLETEKYRAWVEMLEGTKNIVIGSRSAIFAPFSNIGLIIIDEEQEGSFKQEQTPRYHAKDIALKIQKETNSTLILGTATPSVESYFFAKKNKYNLLSLSKRATDSPLPKITIIDLKNEQKKGNKSIFSELLLNEIKKTVDCNEQVILFLNRRGASTHVQCKDCGWVFKCLHCEIPFTYHLSRNLLICHHCGQNTKIPTLCSTCKGINIQYSGTGTQKVELSLKKIFPHARIARMDKDSTTKRNSHAEIYNSFKNHKIDILIGTQMIAKGWDIENVCLVGIINADNALFIPDFRSEEKTFQLLVQVTGRAGRKKNKTGHAIIQTYTPENTAIEFAAKHKMDEFYQKELNNREKFKYPPFANLVKILYNNEEKDKAFMQAQTDKKILEAKYQPLGPIPSFIAKINGKYRFLLILKLNNSELNGFLESETTKIGGVIDINPQNLLN